MISTTLRRCLEDLESRLDPAQEDEGHRQWIEFLEGRCTQNTFTPPQRQPSPPKFPWPDVTVNQAIGSVEAMLLQQFKGCSNVLEKGVTALLGVRCNYGTGILPSLFGCKLFMMEEALNVLPTSMPLGSRDKILPLLDAGVPDIRGGLGGKVFDAAHAYLEVLAEFPKIRKYVAFYHPDWQGPIDVAEVVWGSDIFYAFYEDTQILRDLLNLITETYIVFAKEWYRLVPQAGPYSCHWALLYKGTLMIRNDSLMNLSPEMYVEFVRPLDQRLFDEFGGGAIHFCGRGDHYIEAMSQMTGLSGIAMSQPHLNDMERIYRNTVDKGIKLLGFSHKAAAAANRPLRGQVHCPQG